jgi:hypothetical protein
MFSIDLRETIIPFSLLQIVNQFKRMTVGATIEILGIEEDIISDLKCVLPVGTFELVDAETMNTDSPYFRLLLKKTGTPNIQTKENRHVRIQSEHR